MNYLEMAIKLNIGFKRDCEDCLRKGSRYPCDVEGKCPIEEIDELNRSIKERLIMARDELSRRVRKK